MTSRKDREEIERLRRELRHARENVTSAVARQAAAERRLKVDRDRIRKTCATIADVTGGTGHETLEQLVDKLIGFHTEDVQKIDQLDDELRELRNKNRALHEDIQQLERDARVWW